MLKLAPQASYLLKTPESLTANFKMAKKAMKAGARLSMAVDVLAMLIMVVFIGALLLAPSRRDGKAQQ